MKLKFNDGTVLSLNENSIVVFVGANNSGKSQVLKDVEGIVRKGKTVIATYAEYECVGCHEKFLLHNSIYYPRKNGW